MSVVQKILGGGVAAAAALTIGVLGAMPAAATAGPATTGVTTASITTAPITVTRCLPIWLAATTTTILPLPRPWRCPIIILPPDPILLSVPAA